MFWGNVTAEARGTGEAQNILKIENCEKKSSKIKLKKRMKKTPQMQKKITQRNPKVTRT